MYELIIKRIIDRYKIYTQIDEYLMWKSRFAYAPRKEALYSLVKCSRKHSIEEITLEDLETFKRHCYAFYRTNTMIMSAMREVRCLLRFHKKRGVKCLKPEIVGDLDINYKYRELPVYM